VEYNSNAFPLFLDKMRRPGISELFEASFEPGHAPWKGAVIAIRPPTHYVRKVVADL